MAKAHAVNEVYEELKARQGEKKIYRIAKPRNKATKDLTHIKRVKDEHGTVLNKDGKIKDRWRKYFEHLLNEKISKVSFKGIEGTKAGSNIKY